MDQEALTNNQENRPVIFDTATDDEDTNSTQSTSAIDAAVAGTAASDKPIDVVNATNIADVDCDPSAIRQATELSDLNGSALEPEDTIKKVGSKSRYQIRLFICSVCYNNKKNF